MSRGTPERGDSGPWPTSLVTRLAARGTTRTSFAGLRDRLRGEIELVLNTRRSCVPLPAVMPELARSLLSFGLADLAGEAFISDSGCEDFRRHVEETLAVVLPQLGAVRVERIAVNGAEACLHLRISAVVVLGHEPRALAFESRLIAAMSRFQVENGRDD